MLDIVLDFAVAQFTAAELREAQRRVVNIIRERRPLSDEYDSSIPPNCIERQTSSRSSHRTSFALLDPWPLLALAL